MKSEVIFLCVVLIVIYFIVYSTSLDKRIHVKPEYTNLTPLSIRRNRKVPQSDHFKHSKVIICGLTRDCATMIPHLRQKLQQWSTNFKDYSVVIVENDSRDNTRSLLLDWQRDEPNRVHILGCGLNQPSCKLCLPKTETHTPDQKRIEKMVYLRNLYLEYIKNNDDLFYDYKYVMVVDMDILSYAFDDGFRSTGLAFEQDPTLDAVSSFGVSQLTIKGLNYTVLSIFDPYAMCSPETPSWANDILMNAFKWYEYGDALVKVKSSFSGLTLYRKQSFTRSKYSTFSNPYNEPVCEHVGLHTQMNNIKLNPSMYHIIKENNGHIL